MNKILKKIKSTASELTSSKIFKNLCISSFGSLVLRGISFLLAPITMSILNPQDYGLLALANSAISLSVIFIGLGLRGTFSMEYFHCNTAQKHLLLNSIIFLYLIVALPTLLLACCYPTLINRFIFLNSATTGLIFLSIAYSFLYFFVEIFYQVLSYRAHIVALTIIQVTTALIIIGLNLLFLCWFKWGISGLMAGQVIGLLMVFFIALKAYFQESCHLNFDLRQTLHACSTYLKMGLPFVPSMLLAWMLASSDRWFLAHYGSLHDAGIYALASVFGQLFHMVTVVPMVATYIPYTLKKLTDNKHDTLAVERWNQRNMIYSMVGLSVIVTLGYFAIKPLLYLFLPQQYQEAIQYVWLILMGNIFLLGEQFVSIFIFYNKKIYFQSISFIIPSILSIILNIILIPYFNILGCVLATLVAYMVHFSIKLAYNLHLQKKIRTQQALILSDKQLNKST